MRLPKFMWTYRLNIELDRGRTMSLYGSEKALYIFRDTLQALRARYAEDVLTYMGNGQAEIIPVPEVCAVGDVEPVIRPDTNLSRSAARIEALDS